MKRTTLALLVTAAFASPFALAASETSAQQAPAAASGASSANTPAAGGAGTNQGGASSSGGGTVTGAAGAAGDNTRAADTPATTQSPGQGAGTAPASGTTPGAAQGTPSTPAGSAAMSDADRKRLNETLGTGTAGPDRAQAQMRSMSVDDIEGKDVHNGQGEKIGEVDAVVTNTGGTHYIVISSGGFLGMGKDRGALPADRFWVRDDHLVVLGVTEQDIEGMAEVRTGNDQPYKDADDETMVELAVWQQDNPQQKR